MEFFFICFAPDVRLGDDSRPLPMTKQLNGQCKECGGSLEFPAEAVGTTADCPHCGKPTELLLALPPQERAVPAKTILYTVITIIILVGGLIAALVLLKRAERLRDRNPQPVLAPAPSGNR